jgi:hypothetical protein
MAFFFLEAGLLLKPTATTKPCSQVFFPGCQLGASDPRYVTLSYEYLLRCSPDTALLLHCCGAPAIWAGDDELHRAELAAIRSAWEELGKPVFLLACPSCQKMFRDYLPEIHCRMIYDIFLECGFPGRAAPPAANSTASIASSTASGASGTVSGANSTESAASSTASIASSGTSSTASSVNSTASVYDPCASRYDPDLQQNIRKLALDAGFSLEELPHSREETRCCSWGGQSFTADPSLAKKMIANAVTQNENPYIAYCVNCRDIFSASGKPCWHILDVLYGINDSQRPAPTATARRQNRIKLKRELLLQYGDAGQIAGYGDGSVMAMQDGFELRISEELSRRMSDALILEEDIYAVVRHCEDTGQKLLDHGTGRLIGHLKRGIVTYWAVYAPEEEGCFALIDAYSHRMTIEHEATCI